MSLDEREANLREAQLKALNNISDRCLIIGNPDNRISYSLEEDLGSCEVLGHEDFQPDVRLPSIWRASRDTTVTCLFGKVVLANFSAVGCSLGQFTSFILEEDWTSTGSTFDLNLQSGQSMRAGSVYHLEAGGLYELTAPIFSALLFEPKEDKVLKPVQYHYGPKTTPPDQFPTELTWDDLRKEKRVRCHLLRTLRHGYAQAKPWIHSTQGGG